MFEPCCCKQGKCLYAGVEVVYGCAVIVDLDCGLFYSMTSSLQRKAYADAFKAEEDKVLTVTSPPKFVLLPIHCGML